MLIEIFRQAVIQNHRVLRFDMYTLFLQERSRTLVCTVVTAAFFKSRTTQKVTYRIAGGRFPDNEHKGSWFDSAGNQVIRFDFGHERIKLGHIGEQIELLFQYFFQPHQCQQTRFHILLIECALSCIQSVIKILKIMVIFGFVFKSFAYLWPYFSANQ